MNVVDTECRKFVPMAAPPEEMTVDHKAAERMHAPWFQEDREGPKRVWLPFAAPWTLLPRTDDEVDQHMVGR